MRRAVPSPRAMKTARALVDAALTGTAADYVGQFVELLADTYAQLSEKNPLLKRNGFLFQNTETAVATLAPLAAAWPWDDEQAALAHEAITNPVTGALPILQACLETAHVPKARIADLARMRSQIDKLRAELRADATEDDDRDPALIRAELWQQLIAESTVDELEAHAETIDAEVAARRRQLLDASLDEQPS